MNTVNTTFTCGIEGTESYFDAEKEIARYEEESGKKVSANFAGILRHFAPIINKAYNDGLRDCEMAHGSTSAINISPCEAVQIRKEHSEDELDWAKEMASFYCARPLESNEADFYTFVADVFYAGRISGVREAQRGGSRE